MEMPIRKLSRIIYAENKLLFKDIEDARNTLRYIEGKSGQGNKSKVINTKYFMRTERTMNPYKLPESYQEKRQPFVLPTSCNNISLISDLHIPYHDIDAITIAMKYGWKIR
jgi:hypothetical protein